MIYNASKDEDTGAAVTTIGAGGAVETPDEKKESRRESLLDTVFKHIGPPTLRDRLDSGGKQEITIRIIQARNLPSEDAIGQSDPFVVVTAGGKKYQTSIIKGKKNPVWNDDVVISGKNLFSKIKDLHFDVFDYGMLCC